MPQVGYVGQLIIDGNTLCAVDATLNMEVTVIDVTDRCDSGDGNVIAGIRRATVDFTMVWQSTMDAAAVAVETAFNAKGTVAVQFLCADGEGYTFTAIVSSYSWAQPLDDAQVVSVTLNSAGTITKVAGTS